MSSWPATFFTNAAPRSVRSIFLLGHVTRGATVLVGDPGRSYLPRDKLRRIADYSVPVTRDLEDAEIKQTAVWELLGSGSSRAE